MKSFFCHIIIGITLCGILTSCEGRDLFYNYIISNNSSQEIHLIFYPYEKDEDDYVYKDYAPIYRSNNGFWYGVSYLGKEQTVLNNLPLQSLSLPPGESIVFTYPEYGENLTINPETPDTRAIWLRQNCVKQILIGEDSEMNHLELPADYWSKSPNWVIQTKRIDWIEYWLIIDDEVIREYGIADHQDH